MNLPQWTRSLHHDGSEAYLSNPLPTIGETITLYLRVRDDAPINRVFLRAMLDGEFHMAKLEKIGHDDTVQLWATKLKITQSSIDYQVS